MIWMIRALLISIFVLFTVKPLTAHAGGWLVVTLDSLPEVISGQEATIGFMVRQHGHTPLAGQKAQVELIHQGSGERRVVPAQDSGPTGHYTARLLLPKDGIWEWKIRVWAEHPMPALQVRSSGGYEANTADLAPEPNKSVSTTSVIENTLIWPLTAIVVATAVMWRSRRVLRRSIMALSDWQRPV